MRSGETGSRTAGPLVRSEQPGAEHAKNCGDDSTVSAVETFRFLGSTISQDLKWEFNIDAIRKKAQRRMYSLHQLRQFNLPQEVLIQFYTAIIQSVLCTSITVWFGLDQPPNRTGTDCNGQLGLQKKIIGASLPSIQDLYVSRVRKRAGNINVYLKRFVG
ncbi:hypothetical protein L3Q82_007188 [Scortum barcoo]|uniref:Uncharacterized protein n=1 Tax=Scortum barcoo TaxID=214431 RepID=A0ACB8WVA8_9TELE|nr:hypothetical protein L3Q82_007188 [Scortum barcoo]